MQTEEPPSPCIKMVTSIDGTKSVKRITCSDLVGLSYCPLNFLNLFTPYHINLGLGKKIKEFELWR
jgi:hypothetical protein